MEDLMNDGNSAPEVDPAAEFLAREQDELAGLEDDNFVSGDPAPATDPVVQSGGLLGDDLGSFEAAPVMDGSEAQLNGPSDTYTSISQADRLANEPEKIRKWREEQKEMLEKKDAEAEKLQNEWKEIAKKEVVEWNARQAEQFTKTQSSNRAAEKAFIEERDEVTPGQEWERIARLCDFNPKNNKNCKDVTRLRSILLHLKQTGMAK
ncbi:clathrin light chain B-like isoform X2 [Acanthaster planci]|uniref:Clathrin light chain n=1 Tax=Acanthaster planci TaxID=133434 RepID=A0A8B7Y8K0_ACAPL|nr:clathrin light chain B-like isoform X2 [Acanthaster planci]